MHQFSQIVSFDFQSSQLVMRTDGKISVLILAPALFKNVCEHFRIHDNVKVEIVDCKVKNVVLVSRG